MKKINLFGASGHAKVIVDLLLKNDIVVGYVFDDNPNIKSFLGRDVISNYSTNLLNSYPLIVSIGDNQIRKKIVEKLEVKHVPPLIHPSAIVSPNAKIGKGTVIMPNAVINSGSDIGKNCIINSGAIVEHDCIIKDYVHVSPNVSLAGNVVIGKGAHIGIGSTVIQGLSIGKWSVVGAGAVVTKSIPPNCTAVGIPAKPIKFH